MSKIFTRFITSRAYLLLLLLWLALGTTSCSTTYYYTPNGGTYAGTTTYCQGAPASANIYSYTTGLCGTPGILDVTSSTTCTAQWYVNTTGLASVAGSTAVGAPATFTTSSSGGITSYIPSTATLGVFYYFVNITWSTGTCASPFTSPVQAVTIVAPPGSIGGPGAVCVGNTISLTNATSGGAWTSLATGVATVGATTGVVTGVSAGTATIRYAIGTTCSVTTVVTVSATPTAYAVTGGGSYCAGGTGVHIGLSNSATGVNYQIYNGSTAIGSPVAGTGSALDLGLVTAAGTYTVSAAAAAGGCPNDMTGSATVVINPLPAAISGSPVACVGGTTTLTDATTAGTWSSTATGTATVGASTGVVTGVAAGTATISYTLSTGCAATVVATINPLPVITGNVPVCVGNSISLLSAGSGTWVSGSPAIASVNSSGVVTGMATGTSVVTYTLPTGCSNWVTVTVNAAVPAITGTLAVCQGLTTTLADAATGGTWGTASGAIATIGASSGILSGVAVGTTTVTYTISAGCNATAVATVNILPSAISGPDEVCQGSTITLTDASPGGTWTSSDATIASVVAGTGVVTGVSANTATITYTLPTTCIATKVVTVDPLPAVIGGTLSVCVGLTTTLTNTSAGGTWSSSNASVATIAPGTGVVTGISNGTAIATYTLPTGCIRTAIVTVNALPAAITGTSVVCVAATTTLSDGSAGGTWSSGATGIATVVTGTGVVTGVSAGTATITYKLPTTCIITDVVTVNPLPAAITGPSGICLGATITLSDATAGGTWSSSNAGVAAVGTSTGYTTGNALGTATITYTLGTGCRITYPVTVNPLPVAIGGLSAVCEAGSTITLTDASAGGTWASSSTASATVGVFSGVVTGVSAGTTNITYTLSTGCTATKAITVNALPSATITPMGDTTFCPGGFVLLTAPTAAGNTYVWYESATGVLAGATSPTYIATTSGLYMVYVTNALGCSRLTSPPMTVTVDYPTATITVAGGGAAATCSGTPITLDANTGTGYSYQWLQSGTPIAGATSSSYSTTTPGDFSVIVTTATGCSATSAVTAVTVNPLPSATIALSGPLTFCAGGSVTISVSGGSAGLSYQWYNSSGAIIGAMSSFYTATATDDYWVEVRNVFGCMATSAHVSVLVNPLPPTMVTTSGPTYFCTGGSVLLSAATGTYNYQWYNGATAISGATNDTYTATTTGTYKVRLTDAFTGCSAMSAATPVTVVTTPSIVPVTPASFCWGGNSLLSIAISGTIGTVGYQWYKDGAPIAGATNSTYTATVPGIYKCDVVVPSSCTMTTADVTVTEFPLPNPVIAYAAPVLSTAPYYASYQWYKDAATIAGATGSTLTATGIGDYKVRVTDTNGCQSISAVYTVNTWSGSGNVGVPNARPQDIQVYPNPAKTLVHIESVQEVRAIINSADGRLVAQQDNARDIDISRLADGIYLVRLFDTDGNLLKTVKLLKSND